MKTVFTLVSSLFFLFVPTASFAAEGLVPCGKGFESSEACTICDFVVLADNIIDFFTGLLFIVAITILVIAGVIYIVSAGNQGLISTAKTAIKGALLGAVIVLVAWVLITWGISSVADKGGNLKIYKVGGGGWDFQCGPGGI